MKVSLRKWQRSGELKWPYGFKGPLLKAGNDSPEGPLPVSSCYLFLGSTVSNMGEAKTCPHPREPLSGTPTAQNGGREMIAYVSFTLPRCKFEAHFKDEGDNKRPLTPLSVQNVKTWQSSGELIWP